MQVYWTETHVHINVAGHYLWPKGMTTNPSWSRWVFDHQLRFCLSGSGHIQLSEGELPLSAGACQWLRAGWDYQIVGNPDDPLEFLTIRFDLLDGSGNRRLNSAALPPERLDGIDTEYTALEMRRIIDDLAPQPIRNQVDQKAGSSFVGMRRLRAESRLKALLMEIDERTLDTKAADPKKVHPRILKLQQLAFRLSEHPGQAPSIEDLAAEAEYTRPHFCRAFKQVTGSSPQAFIIHWRMRHARRLLIETSLSIKGIAAELGYRHAEFFSRQFQSETGQTPSAFRQQNLRHV